MDTWLPSQPPLCLRATSWHRGQHSFSQPMRVTFKHNSRGDLFYPRCGCLEGPCVWKSKKAQHTSKIGDKQLNITCFAKQIFIHQCDQSQLNLSDWLLLQAEIFLRYGFWESILLQSLHFHPNWVNQIQSNDQKSGRLFNVGGVASCNPAFFFFLMKTNLSATVLLLSDLIKTLT